jgi:tetratricopeptide (TPR) repeat protein
MLMLVSISAQAQSWKSFLLKGNKYYEKENFTEAEVNYKKALEKNEEAVESVFNLGDALYNQQRFEEAIQQYEMAAKFMPSAKQKAQSWHNIGNAYLQQQDLQKAKDSYIEALKLNPNDPNTKYNLAYVNELMRQQQSQQQQQQQQQQDQKEENEDQEQNQGEDENENDGENEQDPQQNDGEEEEQDGGQGELTKEEAEQLLDALRRQEDERQEELEKKMMKIPVEPDNAKDW